MQPRNHLPVPHRLKRLKIGTEPTCQQRLRLFHKPAGQHLIATLFNPFMQRFPRMIKSIDEQPSRFFRGLRVIMVRRKRATGLHIHIKRTQDSPWIFRVDAPCICGIHMLKPCKQGVGTMLLQVAFEQGQIFRRGRRERCQRADKGLKVQRAPPGVQDDTIPGFNLVGGTSGASKKAHGTIRLGGIKHGNVVMGHDCKVLR